MRESPSPVIWLLSAYHAESHAAWADALVEMLPEVRWRRFELPGRHFAWRIRGNPLSWLDALGDAAVDEPPAALLATSMVDLATIRGLHPRLARTPALLYFHENQFAYPNSDRQLTSIEARMVQLYAALAADRVLFNSAYNRATFLDGVDGLLARMPDALPAPLRPRLESKSALLPVPVPAIPPAAERDPALIVWNHRWEYDKNPDAFADALFELDRRGLPFRLALLGPRGQRPVDALERIRRGLAGRIEVDGHLPRSEYEAVLARAGLVVSTAAHEFQGLAVLEAVRAGCVPVVPDALCYPEWFPVEFRYGAGRGDALVDHLELRLRSGLPAPPDLAALDPVCLAPAWRDELAVLCRQRKAPNEPGPTQHS